MQQVTLLLFFFLAMPFQKIGILSSLSYISHLCSIYNIYMSLHKLDWKNDLDYQNQSLWKSFLITVSWRVSVPVRVHRFCWHFSVKLRWNRIERSQQDILHFHAHLISDFQEACNPSKFLQKLSTDASLLGKYTFLICFFFFNILQWMIKSSCEPAFTDAAHW